MSDQPETPAQRMNRIIRETAPITGRQRLLDSFRRTWAKTTTKPTEENPNG